MRWPKNQADFRVMPKMRCNWLAHTRAGRTRLSDALKDAAAHTAPAKRRVAETAAEEALASEVAARQAETARREQVMLEDVARPLKRAAAD
jgi:hypothetical protein